MSSSPKSSINTPSISRFTHFKTGHKPLFFRHLLLRFAGRAIGLVDEGLMRDAERITNDARQPFVEHALELRLLRLDEGFGDAAGHEFRAPPRREIAMFVKALRREMWPPQLRWRPLFGIIAGNQPSQLFQRRYKTGGIPGFSRQSAGALFTSFITERTTIRNLLCSSSFRSLKSRCCHPASIASKFFSKREK